MKVLIVDDDVTTRTLLNGQLKRWDYETLLAANGEEAWQCVQDYSPDIMLIDWIMPELNGLELCQRIRSYPELADAYIIILSARTDDSDMVNGLEAGADDYIVKPCPNDILRCRLAIGARTVNYRHTLEQQNLTLNQYTSQMEKLVEDRTRQLTHSERIATVGILSAGIAHEINNPLTFISGNIQTLTRLWQDLQAILCIQLEPGEAHQEQLNFIQSHMPEILDDMAQGVKRIANIANGLKAFCRQGDGELVPCMVEPSIQQALHLCHNALKHHIEVVCTIDHDIAPVLADCQQLEQVLVNLIINAADALENKSNGIITIQTQQDEKDIQITVMDNGTGIPADKLEDIWQPFYTTKPVGKGTGLGLSLSMGIIERFGGTISVSNRPEGGAAFVIKLPIYREGVNE